MKKYSWLLLFVLMAIVGFSNKTLFTVQGIVTDAAGNAISGAKVWELKDGATTTTDARGSYKIAVQSGAAVLRFAAAGYTGSEQKVANRSTINVVLKTNKQSFQEIVMAESRVKKMEHRGMPAVSMGKKTYGGLYSDSYDEDYNTEGYDYINENSFRSVAGDPLSTFSIDVDAASYSNVRRMLQAAQMPPAGAVRVEEMINYFNYNYPQPKNGEPFSFTTELGTSPWNSQHQLVLIGMQGRKIPTNDLPPANLVFLIDVSGSMASPNKLPLVKASLKMLTEQLREQDKVSIVVYAGAAGLVLPPTSGAHKTAIKDALEKLTAGGSTAGGAGIELAYKTARENFKAGANNRVILCSDGDFNIGMSSDDAMERLIEKERKTGIYLTVLGYGMGNYKDNKLQKLADKGNGNHAYIDGMSEAKKVLVNEFGGTLFTIAKDVKLQVEFNPAYVQAYRLVGYENRLLNKEDFNNDEKDAGELGSGHTVTAIYEIIPVGVQSSMVKNADPLKYHGNQTAGTTQFNNEIMTIKFRYKTPGSEKSQLLVHPVLKHAIAGQASENFRFAAAVAEFGMLLRNSAFKGNASYASVLKAANSALTFDKEGYRREFIRMVESAQYLVTAKTTVEADAE